VAWRQLQGQTCVPLRQTTKLEDIRFFQDVQPVFCCKKVTGQVPKADLRPFEAKAYLFNSVLKR
jgi:hypothetical protein